MQRSLDFAYSCPVMEFGPDAAFACDLCEESKAEAFLNEHGLEKGKFLCCIPRLRFTPYWTIPGKNQDFNAVKHARNEEMKEHDHAPLRQAIVEVIRQTDLKILICPEDQTQMLVGKELLLDKLPAHRGSCQHLYPECGAVRERITFSHHVRGTWHYCNCLSLGGTNKQRLYVGRHRALRLAF